MANQQQQQAVQQPPTDTHQPIFKIEYTIGDSVGYRRQLIEKLRAQVPRNVIETKVIETDKDANGNITEKTNGTHTLRVLEERKSPLRWIHIKLCVGGGGATTTLAIRADNLYVKGFMNGEGKWFELWELEDTEADRLPMQDGAYTSWAGEGEAKMLEGWGVSYGRILSLSAQGQVEKMLMSTRLGRAFAKRAVRRLSLYPDLRQDQGDDMPTRLGLAGLIVIICEAARMDPILTRIEADWNNTEGLMIPSAHLNRIWEWKDTSASLLNWLEMARLHWDKRCEIDSPAKALKCFHLLLNTKDVEGSGRARVEIFKVYADFHVRGIKVVDEQGTHIQIYSDSPDEQQTGSLVLKDALKQGISAYKGFDIIVKSQTPGGGPEDSITMKWDCRKNDRGNTEYVTRNIVLEKPKRTMKFEYLVMSNAIQATVEVMVRLEPSYYGPYQDMLTTSKNYSMENLMDDEQDGGSYSKSPRANKWGEYTARGTITARIDGYDHHKIVLFSQKKGVPLKEPPEGVYASGPLLLEQMLIPIRSDVPVQRGKLLHIDMEEMVVTDNATGEQVLAWTDDFRFNPNYGRWSTEASYQKSNRVKVKVTWQTLPKEEAEEGFIDERSFFDGIVVDNINGPAAFSGFIQDVRKFAVGCSRSDDDGSSSSDDLPVLPVPCDDVRKASLVHINIKVKAVAAAAAAAAAGGKKEEYYTTTLAVRNDKFYGVGFRNNCGVWFDLGTGNNPNKVKILPAKYRSVLLGWGVSYKRILQADLWHGGRDSVLGKLRAAKLGKEFASKAVRMLSRYPDVEMGDAGMNPKLALAGLMLMVCESAKLDPLRRAFADGWDKGTTEFTGELLDCMFEWEPLSKALLSPEDEHESSLADTAKDVLGLVLNRKASSGNQTAES